MQSSKRQIGVGTLTLGWREWWNVARVLKSGRLSYGPYASKFEKEFAKAHDSKYAVFVNSGTSALSLAIAALREVDDWQDGDEVLVPALTFVASSNVILEHRLKPVFVDVDRQTYNLDPTQLEAAITPRTKAIMVVHLFGQVAEMDPIMEIAKKHNLRVIEDSCETMGVGYKGRKTGSFGDISCFSTYVAHLIVTGVGGLAVTSDENLAEIIRSLANHGRDNIYISIDDDQDIDGSGFREVIRRRFRFVRRGYSFRCTELEAAIGCAQLLGLPKMVQKRHGNAMTLSKLLEKFSEHLQLPSYNSETHEHAFMMYPIVLQPDCQFSKDDVVYHLEQHGIETRDMMPLINQPVYEYMNINHSDYPVSDWINKNGFYIGCHQSMSKADMEYVHDVFEELFGG